MTGRSSLWRRRRWVTKSSTGILIFLGIPYTIHILPLTHLNTHQALYRASFCQTLAEVEAPTGEGKSILGCVLVAVSIGIWGYFWMKSVVYGALPDTITSDEKQKAQIDRMIAIRANPVEGISSNYDYEKGQWKK